MVIVDTKVDDLTIGLTIGERFPDTPNSERERQEYPSRVPRFQLCRVWGFALPEEEDHSEPGASGGPGTGDGCRTD